MDDRERKTVRLKEILLHKSGKSIVDNFHKLYYGSSEKTWNNTFWLGFRCQKCALDLWIYQEIISDLRPDIIIECGTAAGGTTLFLACLCKLAGNGKVISIDIEDRPNKPQHERITYLSGSDISEEIIQQVKKFLKNTDRVMVILDSDHSKDHVLQELKIYSRLVTPGSYIIVEDPNIGGHPVKPKFGYGPMEAIQEFLQESNNFIIDQTKEKFYLTFNPNGYLKRIG